MNYREQLWEEIARNDPQTAKFIRDMRNNFSSKLQTFRWLKEPRYVFCTWHRRES